MGMSRAEILKKVAASSASGGGNNLRDGRGRLAIKSLALQEGFHGSRFVASMIVVGSQKIPVVQIKTGKAIDIEPNQPGTDVSVVQMLDKHASSFGNVKAFMLALFGMAETEVTDEDFVATLDEVTLKNTARGMLIDYDTYRHVTSEKQIEIVLANWYRVEQEAEDIGKTRAWMESLLLGQKAAIAGSTGAAATA